MRKLLKSSWIRFIVIPFLLSFVLISSYVRTAKTIPVSFFDEMLWVGRSYFFQLYIHRDFSNPAWQEYESYDQPKLGEYAFGAWLYPRYLKEAKREKPQFSYGQFLATYGLLWSDSTRMFSPGDEGPPQFWAAKYGPKSLKTLDLIYYARNMNVLLLTGSIIFAYYFVLLAFGLIPAVLFTALYSFNPLLMQMGLKAHSEALFLLLFNTSMFFMLLYFRKKHTIVSLLLFSVSAGLCMATKLNGLMLPVLFLIIHTLMFDFSNEDNRKKLLAGAVPAIIGFVLLVAINPFTYSDPIGKTTSLFTWRTYIASGYQSRLDPKAVLPDALSRFRAIGVNFFSSARVQYFNGSELLKSISPVPYYNYFLVIVTVIGIVYVLRLILKKNISAIVTGTSFAIVVTCMGCYLVLNWDRYYVQLPLFFVLFETLGLYWMGKYCLVLIRKRSG